MDNKEIEVSLEREVKKWYKQAYMYRKLNNDLSSSIVLYLFCDLNLIGLPVNGKAKICVDDISRNNGNRLNVEYMDRYIREIKVDVINKIIDDLNSLVVKYTKIKDIVDEI